MEVDGIDPPGTRFVVTASGVHYAFAEGSWALFGRDDEQCTLVVWECLLGQELSRVAGILWCLDGELWVRNASCAHELVVDGHGSPHLLPPGQPDRRGAACTLPATGGAISAPSTGSWRLEVVTLDPREAATADNVSPTTITLPRPPEDLLPTAAAMCAPLLRRGHRPATYRQIAEATAAKPRTARDRVDRLLRYYEAHGTDRLWSHLGVCESYYEPLARLLVYRSVITLADLDASTTKDSVSAPRD